MIRLINTTTGSSGHECGAATYVIITVLGVLPAWFRFAQCIRRFYDTGKVFPHFVNAGKYSTSFFVVLFAALVSSFRKDGKQNETKCNRCWLI